MTQQERTPFEQLGTFFMVWMGCFLLFNLLSVGILLGFYGPKVYEMISNADGSISENLNLIRFLQIILSIGIFGVPPIVFILITKPREWTFFRLHKLPPINLTALTIVIVAVSAPLILWALKVNQEMKFPSAFQTLENYLRDLESQNEKMMESLLVMNSASAFLINFLMIAVIPAFVEEFLFRGTLQQLLSKTLGDVHLAIIVTGMFFSFIHFQFYGFLPRMMLGILFGYLFFWSGNLWIPILAHFLNNGVQVVMVYLFQSGKISLNIDEVQAFPPLITMISTILLFTVVFIFDVASYRTEAQEVTNGKRLG